MSMRYRVSFEDGRVGSFARVRPVASVRGLARWMVGAGVALALSLAWVPWQQSAFGDGQVVAYSPDERQQRVDAPLEGWLEEWFVQEGSHVEEGAPIARIVDNDPELLQRLRSEQEAAHARLKAAERALDTALRNVRRQWQLFNQGLSSRKQYEEAQLKEADVMKELTSARAELARVDTRLARQGRQLVTAPRAGVILRRSAGNNSVYVKTGEMLAVLVPETRSRAVELWMDGNDLPLVMRGRQVRLQFEGWPAVQASGWPSVAVGTFGGEVSVVDAAGGGQPGRFRILVTPRPGEPWPASELLRQGVRAHGWVMLEQVPLGYELWRRFNAFPPALSKAPPEEAASQKK
ncbi:RND family efflux transporter MFP subunit [Corallococcus coralloides]|uniref:RND family efflux transporter MFP subunit n=1 Tax=Corallococcus coralloides TaxID=184914 RepID=A0A410RKI1_CORCK|nr:HlyD family efflux transporter periplasmic adaptor subunit [Corallococcus coralloides]QAT82427.1 RND family efflux transporter MFP subunit [Corallococcus coralloides]